MEMENRIIGMVVSTVLLGILGLATPWFAGGCGSKDQDPKADEVTQVDKVAPSDRLTGEDRDRPRRGRKDPGLKGKRGQQGEERSGRKDQLRKWASQHLYMDLALTRLGLSDEQMNELSNLNWEHFSQQLTKEGERTNLDKALGGMLASGKVDEKFLQQDAVWNGEMKEQRTRQYRERITALHRVLTKEQRTQLVKLVEKEQKARYAKADQDSNDTAIRAGCGGGNRLKNRLLGRIELRRGQERRLAALKAEVEKQGPKIEELKDYQQAKRILDGAMRNAFVTEEFDVSSIVSPELPACGPLEVSKRSRQELGGVLEILTERQRLAAAKEMESRKARRTAGEGEMPPVDGGLESQQERP